MKRLTPFMLIFLTACAGAVVSDKKLPEAKETPLATLKEFYEYDLTQDSYRKINAQINYTVNHKDEILKTLEVAEVDSIPGKDFVLVFYRYSIGSEIAHSDEYMKKIDGKYFLYPTKYYSSYEEDPFSNGQGLQGKALLKKLEEWTGADKDVWWK
jgi:hypothetical protein